MPSNLPSSFASAAAGQNANREGRSGSRSDGRANTSGDWYVCWLLFIDFRVSSIFTHHTFVDTQEAACLAMVALVLGQIHLETDCNTNPGASSHLSGSSFTQLDVKSSTSLLKQLLLLSYAKVAWPQVYGFQAIFITRHTQKRLISC